MAERGNRGPDPAWPHPVLVFLLLFLAVFVLHLRLLGLPYFWDEAGYYIPAARDLLLTGSLIPQSSISNAHPPLVLAYLALVWKIVGYTPVVTRTAMLAVAAFALLGLFQLARRVANIPVAIATVFCTALYPVFFAQSSLAHLDLAAAAFTFWGLHAYVEEKWTATAIWFSLGVLAKETAVLAPLALFGWEVLCPFLSARFSRPKRQIYSLLVPVLPLALWYGFHYWKTGHVFGNPEFFRYNVQATLHPLRIGIALLLRLWQTFVYMDLFVLTIAMALAMWLAPRWDEVANQERPRIDLRVQCAFGAVVLTYVIAMAVVGGAVLARYMLPVVPLVVLLAISTLWRRVRYWVPVVALVAAGFVWALFVDPPYEFAPEDNLAYRDFIVLHQHAAAFAEARYPMSRVLTAWPANDELSRPYLGYVTRPLHVVRIEDFSVEELMSAADARSQYDVALVFSTKCAPPHSFLENWQTWQDLKKRFFGYHRDLPPATAAQVLGGQLAFSETRGCQWVGVVEMQRAYDVELQPGGAGLP